MRLLLVTSFIFALAYNGCRTINGGGNSGLDSLSLEEEARGRRDLIGGMYVAERLPGFFSLDSGAGVAIRCNFERHCLVTSSKGGEVALREGDIQTLREAPVLWAFDAGRGKLSVALEPLAGTKWSAVLECSGETVMIAGPGKTLYPETRISGLCSLRLTEITGTAKK